MARKCPVCSRNINNHNPQKGDVAWETTYCSHYCRLFDERGLTKVPFKGGNKHHNNKLCWPVIKIPCDMCEEKEATLKHDIERGNTKYCSRKCWGKLKASQKRHIHRTINALHYLEHSYKYEGNRWLDPSAIAEMCSVQGSSCGRSSIGLLMKRWREAGIVEARVRSVSSNGFEYRFRPEGLRGMRVSQFVHHWNTMSYAERMAFVKEGQPNKVAIAQTS